MRARAHSRRDAGFLLPVLLLCLALRAAIPTGWMPEFNQRGVSLVACSGWTANRSPQPAAQAEHVMHGAHHGEERQDGSGKHDMAGQPCAFAAAAADVPSPAAPDRFEPLAPTEPLLAVGATVAVGRGLAAPPPPSTGPPHVA